MTLVETGTRGLLGAVLGSAGDRDEATLASRLLPILRPGMLVLLDRAFDANALLADIAATGAMLLPAASPPATRRCSSTCPTAPTCRAWRTCPCGSSKPTSP